MRNRLPSNYLAARAIVQRAKQLRDQREQARQEARLDTLYRESVNLGRSLNRLTKEARRISGQ